MKYMLVATLTEYCSWDVYRGLLEPIRHSNIAPMGLSNEAGLSVDCGGQIGGWAGDGRQFRRWVVIGIMGLRAQSDGMLSLGDEWNMYGVCPKKGNLRTDMALMENRPAWQDLVQKSMTMLHLEMCSM